jgi:alanyl aminopeptidase
MRTLLGFVFAFFALGATPPAFRLPGTARPERYELELTVVPRQMEFHGVARIWVRFAEPAKSLWLNAKDLTIQSASITVRGAARNLKTTSTAEFLDLEFDQEVPAGPALVEIAYQGQLSDKSNSGLYRKNAGSDWYAYTTFTPIEARRAFPCFDEPGYKAPWRIVLHVPLTDVAASNARISSETEEPGGMKRVEFVETKPMASEVVAIAVGPFDVVDAGAAGSNHVPVRVLTPRGHAGDAAAARDATQDILARLEQYTGIPYPWDKLDHVAVLDMPYGAVENPGLITYRDRVLIAKPARDTPERQRAMRATMAHELAHQWFGNLVTQAWWDDVWLSEGFATWLGTKISDLELPVFERSMAAAGSRGAIMRMDAAADSRPVRLEMRSRKEMDRVYSGIVYQKGAAILNMVEQWIGPEMFRRGLQAYLSEYALGNATTAGLAAALTKESGVDVAPVFNSFLDQRGFPTIRAGAACAFEPGDSARWTIPLCVHGDDGASQCQVLSPIHPASPLEACPAWVWPNRGGSGYFRVEFPKSMLERIVTDGWEQLTGPERLSVVEDMAYLATSHKLDADTVLRAIPAMARDSQPAVANAAYRLLLLMTANSPPEDRAKYEAVARQLMSGGRGRP